MAIRQAVYKAGSRMRRRLGVKTFIYAKTQRVSVTRVNDEIRRCEPQFSDPGLVITQTTCAAYITAMPCHKTRVGVVNISKVIGSETCIFDFFGVVSSTPIRVMYTQVIDRLLIRDIFDDYHARIPSMTGVGVVC